jgi:hypothetical protein
VNELQGEGNCRMQAEKADRLDARVGAHYRKAAFPKKARDGTPESAGSG